MAERDLVREHRVVDDPLRREPDELPDVVVAARHARTASSQEHVAIATRVVDERAAIVLRAEHVEQRFGKRRRSTVPLDRPVATEHEPASG